MEVGKKRMLIARIVAVLAVVCGVIGLLAGLTVHTWKLSPWGWFHAGTLLVGIAIFIHVDGAVAFQKSRVLIIPNK